MARQKYTKTRYQGVFRREDGRLVIRASGRNPKFQTRSDLSRLLPEGASLSDAREAVAELAAEARGERVRPQYPTLSDFARQWVERKVRRGDWRMGSTTSSLNVGILENHILPSLGGIYLDKLETRDLVDWMDAQLESGAKANTVRTRWGTLQGLVTEACSDLGLPDVTRAVRPPKRTPKGGADMVLMPAELRALLDHVDEHLPDWSAFFWLGFASGARLSELCLVKLSDLDLTREVGRWTIRRHYGQGSNIVPGSKSGPEREIYLDPVSTSRLRDLTEGRWGADWLTVLPEHGNRDHRQPGRSSVRRAFAVINKARGGHLSSKVFRQTHTTLSRLSGVALAVVHEQVGHTSEAMSNVYTRIPSSAREEAARKLANVVDLQLTGTNAGTSDGQ